MLRPIHHSGPTNPPRPRGDPMRKQRNKDVNSVTLLLFRLRWIQHNSASFVNGVVPRRPISVYAAQKMYRAKLSSTPAISTTATTTTTTATFKFI